MHFQIRSRRKNRQRYTWVVKIRVLGEVFSKQFVFSDAEDNISVRWLEEV